MRRPRRPRHAAGAQRDARKRRVGRLAAHLRRPAVQGVPRSHHPQRDGAAEPLERHVLLGRRQRVERDERHVRVRRQRHERQRVRDVGVGMAVPRERPRRRRRHAARAVRVADAPRHRRRRLGGGGGGVNVATTDAASGGAAAEPEAAQTEFSLKLDAFDASSKIKVIKEVRAATELGLKEAKELVEGAPCVLKKGLSKEDAEAMMAKIVAAGATCSLE